MVRLTIKVNVCISMGFDIQERIRISNYYLLAGFVLPCEQEEDNVPVFLETNEVFYTKKGKYYITPYKTRIIKMKIFI